MAENVITNTTLVERFFKIISLQYGYNSTVVVLGTCFLGVASGVIGTFTYLRGRAMVSDAMSHAALPGIALAFIFASFLGFEGRSLPILLFGAAVSGVFSVFLVQLITQYTRLQQDAAIGSVLSFFFGAGVVLLSYIQSMPSGGQGGLETFILGEGAAMSQRESITIGSLALLSIGVCSLFFKEFRMVCFDPEFGEGQGWPVFRIDMLMLGLMAFVTVIGLQTVGLILIIALLIIPAVAARFWFHSLTHIIITSGVIGGLSGYFGATLSALWPNMPAGGLIVLAAGTFFLISFFFAPRRGLLAFAAHHVWLVIKFKEMRSLIALEQDRFKELPLSKQYLNFLAFKGLYDRENKKLTHEGQKKALEQMRNLVLWERLLQKYPQSLPNEINWGIDALEDVLPKDTYQDLLSEEINQEEINQVTKPNAGVTKEKPL